MDETEKILRKNFEDVTTRNVTTAVDFSQETRRIVRKLEKKIELLEGIIRQQDKQNELIRLQLSKIQMKVYSGGT